MRKHFRCWLGSGLHKKFRTKSSTTFDFLSKAKTRPFLTSEMQLTFAPARLSIYFVKKFNLIGKYVLGSGPHEKFWTKTLTTLNFFEKEKLVHFLRYNLIL